MESKKKVLLVANVAKEHILKFHVPFIKFLKENGWTVDVACSGDEKIPYCDNQIIMPYKRNPFATGTLKGVKKLKFIVEEGNYNIIHCHTPTGGLVTRLAKMFSKTNYPRIIYTCHGFHFFKNAPLINWLLFFPIEWVLSFFTDDIITINNEDFSNLSRFHFKNKNKFIVKGVGVNVKDFIKEDYAKYNSREELNLSQSDLVLIYVAELNKNKNQELLLKCLKELLDRGISGKLLLVGPDYSNGKYMNLAKKLQIIDNVRFLGWRSDVKELLNMSDIYLASSIREGLGVNVIEAQLMRLPVIASNNRGHSTIINCGTNGVLNNFDYIMMADSVIKMINNLEYKNQIVENGYQSALQYDVSTINKKLLEIYDGRIESDK